MKLNTGFSNYTDTGLADKGDAIYTALNGNAKFPGIGAELAALEALIKILRDAIASTGPGRTQAIAEARIPLATALNNLADKLVKVPGTTEADLATTGYDLPAARTASPVPGAPQNLHLQHGDNPGEVKPLCDAITTGGVRAYHGQWTLDPNNGPWNEGGSFSSSRTMLLTGLPRGKDIWVRVRVQGTAGFGPWSDPATIMVT